jgi:hypothetical protein
MFFRWYIYIYKHVMLANISEQEQNTAVVESMFESVLQCPTLPKEKSSK